MLHWTRIAEVAAARGASPETINRLMAAPIPRLRRMALVRLLDGGGAPAMAAATKALMDANRNVRGWAQDYLTRTGVEVPRVYAGQLDSRPALAILRLAETGSRDHMGPILAHVSHPSAKVRDAVCHAIAVLDVHRQRDALLALSRDRCLRVARHAAAAIVRSGASHEELDELWSSVTTHPAGRAVLSAFEQLDRWVQLTYAFRAIASGMAAEEGKQLLGRVMARWNASFTSPSPERADELAVLLPRVLSRLDSGISRELAISVDAHLRPR